MYYNELDFFLANSISHKAKKNKETFSHASPKDSLKDAIHSLVLLLSYQIRQGHVCLDLAELPKQWPMWYEDSLPKEHNKEHQKEHKKEWNKEPKEHNKEHQKENQKEYNKENSQENQMRLEQEQINSPELKKWLLSSKLVCCINQNSSLSANDSSTLPPRPLVFDKTRLYFFRYYAYEKSIHKFIQSRYEPNTVNSSILKKILSQSPFFTENQDSPQSINAQNLAIVLGIFWKFLIISGGPGTGKTTTIIQLIAFWIQYKQASSSETFRIAILAPTGKAVMRLKESLSLFFENLPEGNPFFDSKTSKTMQANLKVQTIHSFLGSKQKDFSFRHNRKNPIVQDLVIIDEASLLDISLFVHLLEALQTHTSLILVGDADQLASVESGQLLGDLCSTNTSFTNKTKEFIQETLQLPSSLLEKIPHCESSHLSEHIVFLDKNYRFSHSPTLTSLANFIKQSNGSEIQSMIKNVHLEKNNQVHFYLDAQSRESFLKQKIQEIYFPAFIATDPVHALEQFQNIQILTALRSSAVQINQWILHSLNSQKEKLSSNKNIPINYPIMVTQNNPILGLYNGDTGIVAVCELNQRVALFKIGSKIKKIPLSYLNHYDLAFAMTVHKSQGSEYDTVILCILASNSELVLFNRELFYTAVTRAKEQVHLLLDEELLLNAITKKTQRYSGLAVPFNP